MTLTKEHLINTVHNHLDIPKKKSAALVETVLESIKYSLEKNEDVLISGFGKFCVKNKNERRGRNPATGEGLTLNARKVVVFKCSGVLRERVNGKGKNNLER